VMEGGNDERERDKRTPVSVPCDSGWFSDDGHMQRQYGLPHRIIKVHWHRSIIPRGERRGQKASEKGRSKRHKIKIKDKDKVQDSQPTNPLLGGHSIKPSTKVDG
jgi:hypothetical protein